LHAEPHIREATPDDFPAMLGMARAFIMSAWGRIGVAYDEPSCRALLEGLHESPLGILLIDDARTAMMGAVVHAWPFNANILTATELFWWTHPGSRAAVAMWREAEMRAAQLGAQTFNMASQDHMRSMALGRLYGRHGYAPSEHIYIKEIG
jgi:hypothetical protein